MEKFNLVSERKSEVTTRRHSGVNHTKKTSGKVKEHRFLVQTGGKILVALEKLIVWASRVPTDPILENRWFPWTEKLEKNWRVIRDEAEAILRDRDKIPNLQDISKDQAFLTKDDQWKTFFLIGFGNRVEYNCRQCPRTAEMLECIPGITTAMFSILSPGKHIPHHRGLLKGLLRYHLGIIVPQLKEQCRIRVHDQIVHWEEKKGFVFDDTYDHEVWNDTPEQRIVLLIDVVRPTRFPVSLLNSMLLWVVKKSAFVKDAQKNQELWEKKIR